ncbi:MULTISPECIES: PIG-L family deacetylase [Legionella]|uniref:Response regulator n=1 Tax=Legionella septentrionalis TaxID=2498109 RepID=A0A3S0V9R0_9GAMM|nr:MULTISPECIES: PIG-L family deacetylase [Legionella]MCP0913165.1 PIG-L family deacetylase [Legionella sp. 27cVA30]RUQ81572.1 response regulator [Legionella septentrionalis]RUR02451.1 response regulator [Legionella septentrionalis]RUR09308.1 response regulator [Legionella septentrionalis]RUR17109.1 response regulator [Legionella septentrionalis]
MKKFYKILLIEPDLALAQKIIEWIQPKAEITHVADNQEAKKQAVIRDWDLVITDINVSEINDLHITRLVKKSNPSTAILIIAENIKVDFILTAMKYHADGLFFKPLDKKEFVTRALELAEESKLKKAKNNKVVLAIGAHPDDVEFGCGGTLARLKSEGSDINILTLSMGGFGGDPEVRKREAQKAAQLQGAKLFLGDFFDTKIDNGIETIQFIETVVEQVKPTHVYTHSIFDYHQDHRSTYQATVIACRTVPNLFSYLSPSSTVDFRPNVFINIDKFIKKKQEAIAVYTSQMDIRQYLKPEMIRAIALYWGRFNNYSLVEPMEIIKEAL